MEERVAPVSINNPVCVESEPGEMTDEELLECARDRLAVDTDKIEYPELTVYENANTGHRYVQPERINVRARTPSEAFEKVENGVRFRDDEDLSLSSWELEPKEEFEGRIHDRR